MADLPILLLAGSVLGAALNIIRGVSNDTTGKLNYKKVVGGGVTAVIAALGAIVALDAATIVEPTTQLVVGVLVSAVALLRLPGRSWGGNVLLGRSHGIALA